MIPTFCNIFQTKNLILNQFSPAVKNININELELDRQATLCCNETGAR